MSYSGEPPNDTFEYLRGLDVVAERVLLRCFERYIVACRALIPETVVAVSSQCPDLSEAGLLRIIELTTQCNDYWSSTGVRDLANGCHEVTIWAKQELNRRQQSSRGAA